MHMDGHRVAFNKSLARMGYECAQFTPPIYNDLLQGGDGTAEGLVTAYFKCMGWPMMLATSDQPLFIKKAGRDGSASFSFMPTVKCTIRGAASPPEGPV